MIGTIMKIGGYALLAREAADIVISSRQYHERQQSRKRLAGSIGVTLVGMALGVGIGMLYAPRPGRETRDLLTEKAHNEIDRFQSGLIEGKDKATGILKKKRDEICADSGKSEKRTAK